MGIAQTNDLISMIAFVFLIVQTIIYAALRARLTFAKKATQILPQQIKNIGLILISVMQLNYMYTAYSSGSGHYQAILLFSLLILLSYNSAYANLLDEATKANLNLEILKKQSKATADAYMKLLGEKDTNKQSVESDKHQDLKIRMLQEQIEVLKGENSELKLENEEMKKKGFSAKKNQ